ncbi:MAG: YfiR family protein [Xanthomonadales bacterium]|nr:YfiR family protein [Xanthomonadales bacterium]
MNYFSTIRNFLGSALAALLLCCNVQAAEHAGEYEVKAVYLYNFARFFEWPGSAFTDDDAELSVCIYGEDPFGSALNRIAGKLVRGRPLGVTHLRRGEALAGCQVVYVSDSEQLYVQQLLAEVRKQPLLTVSDIPNFARNGGVIGLKQVGNKVRFEINTAAASAATLEASSQLLKLATSVIDSTQ